MKQDIKLPFTTILPDYDEWFAKEVWTPYEAAYLLAGLNPLMMEVENLHQLHSDGKLPVQVDSELTDYNDNFPQTLAEIIKGSESWFHGSWRSGDMDSLETTKRKDGTVLGIKIWDLIQYCFDARRSWHYSFDEYLKEKTDFEFTFSRHSKILSELMIFAKKDVWLMTDAANLVLGISPDLTAQNLDKIKNFNRNMEGNYTLTKSHERYFIMELAMDSYKTGNLEFFEILGDDPTINYYSDEECGVYVEAKEFMTWAIKKGFKPPKQLLEGMGIIHPKNEPKAVQEPLEKSFSISYSDATNEIWLNDFLLLAKPHHNSENEQVFRFLYQNPNRLISKEEFAKHSIKYGKRPAQIINDLGFKGVLGKAFFTASEKGITFRNPMTPDVVKQCGLEKIFKT